MRPERIDINEPPPMRFGNLLDARRTCKELWMLDPETLRGD